MISIMITLSALLILTPAYSQAQPVSKTHERAGPQLPSQLPSQSLQSVNHIIEIDISDRALHLFEVNGEGTKVFKRKYLISTPKRGLKPIPLGKGRITKIEFDPWWYPTRYSRWYFKERLKIDLPAKVPPGDPLNFMGAFKIYLSHRTYKGAIYRIHGNNDPKTVGKQVTGGCFRMYNKEGVELARQLKVGVPVIIQP